MRFCFLFLLFLSFGVSLTGQDPITLSPNSGKRGTTFTVTISGVNTAFIVNTTTLARISKDTAQIDINGLAADATIFNGTLSIPTNADTGAYNATIWQSGKSGISWSCSNCFNVQLNCSLVIDAQVNQIACFGDSSGQIDLTITGATGDVHYVWNTEDTTEDLTHLGPGAYVVTVTDAEGCSASRFFNIFQPSQVNAISSRDDVTFYNGNNGKATVRPQGGTPPYTISWSNGTTGETITNLSPGLYAYTVTDANGCTYIGREEFLNFNCTITDTITKVDLMCYGDTSGSATININFANPPVSYFWSNGATTSTATGLGVGKYFVTVTDFRRCPLMDSVDILEPEPLSLEISTQAVSMVGANDGRIIVSPAGGKTPYTLIWNNEATEDTLLGLTPGIYSVTLTDANGCMTSGTTTVADIDCSGFMLTIDSIIGDTVSEIFITASGGLGDLTYQWFKDGELVDSSRNLLGASSGHYSIRVSDGRGCIIQDTLSLISTTIINVHLSHQTRVYPNPALDVVNIHFPDALLGAQLDIYNLHGQLIHRQIVTEVTHQVNSQRWPTGLYVLRGSRQGITIMKKFQIGR